MHLSKGEARRADSKGRGIAVRLDPQQPLVALVPDDGVGFWHEIGESWAFSERKTE